MRKDEYWLWLASVPGVGCRTALKLFGFFKDIQHIYEASERELAGSSILKQSQIENLIGSRDEEKIRRMSGEMTDKGIRCVSFEDESYPTSLTELYDPPSVLFVKGMLPEDDEWIMSVVGARSCTPYGRYMSRNLSRGMAFSGMSVVSGMARGIDSEAHLGALDAGGRTYAVLGCGTDICYPPENMDLYEEIASHGGLISEYLPGTEPDARHFPVRNRIIAALGRGVLVVEARRKSGAMITAEQGLELGREIFAVPGRADDALNEGTNMLIKSGAKMVTEVSDILEEFDILAREYKKNNITLDNYEKVVYSSICLVPRSADEVAVSSGLDIRLVMRTLTSLELKGAIRRAGQGRYVLSV